jgi:ComF family protein
MARIVQEIKYRFVRDLVSQIGGLADSQLKDQAAKRYLDFWRFMGSEPIVVPVPLHPTRFNWRGFNQAEALSRRLGQVWQVPVGTQLLQRVKVTKSQVELKGKARQENVKGAFRLNTRLAQKPQVLKGKAFLLVDDVWTTGSTMRECGKVLKQAGADQIWGLTLAQ